MFIENKYSRIYNRIIDKAKNRSLLEKPKESHHIVPSSLGGPDTESNLVDLTLKEHFICHLLLPKMCSDSNHRKKMMYALWMMANRMQGNSKDYIREKIKGFSRGRVVSEEGRSNIRKARSKQVMKPLTESIKEQIRTSNQKFWSSEKSDNVKAQISKKNSRPNTWTTSEMISPEARERIADKQRDKTVYTVEFNSALITGTIHEITVLTGIRKDNVRNVCQGHVKQTRSGLVRVEI